jgi:hypothetical protein
MADSMQNEAPDFEDIEFSAPPPRDFTTIPEDDYVLECIGFTTVDKPPHVIESEAVKKKKTVEEIDPQQWEWLFKVAEGKFAGETLKDWTNRTWHEKSSAGIYAAALAGLEKYDRAAMIARGFASTRALLGKQLKATVVEVERTEGVFRNYINNPRRLPVHSDRPRPQRNQTAQNTFDDDKPAVPHIQLPDDIFDDNYQPTGQGRR